MDADPARQPYAYVRTALVEPDWRRLPGWRDVTPAQGLAELVTTCPQYCGNCTRMDLVGNSTAQVAKARFALRPASRQELMLDYLKRTPAVRDVVVSGGDVANLPWHQLESFLRQL